MLRRVYTEVADGGFGPGPRGFAPIGDVAALHDGRPWFELAPGGCSMYWYADLSLDTWAEGGDLWAGL
ncbi:hypothetical protein ACQPZJ_32810 [Actinoplanes sp. CA-054009]